MQRKNRLFVGGLDYSIGEEELVDCFKEHGNVHYAKVILDRDTGRSRGFGFVTMKNDEEAQKAVDNVNGKFIKGRKVHVTIAEDRRK